MTDQPAYITVFHGAPTAVATDLAAAQAAVLADRTRPASADRYENRWDKHGPDEWRLMTRPTGRGGRWSWTQRSIRKVPVLPATVSPPTDRADEAPPADRIRALALLEAAEFVRDAHFRDGLTAQEIGTALGHMADEADPMVGSLSRDGFDHDEITTILTTSVAEALLADTDEAQPAAAVRPDDTTGA